MWKLSRTDSRRMYSDKDINEVKEIILNIVKPEEIILFGSYANGTNNDRSDIDIIVLLKKKLLRKERIEYLRHLYRMFYEKNLEVDIILKNKKYYEDTKKYIGTVNYDISKNGRTLWKKN